jgi:hypothetical protein
MRRECNEISPHAKHKKQTPKQSKADIFLIPKQNKKCCNDKERHIQIDKISTKLNNRDKGNAGEKTKTKRKKRFAF